nr:hypothetical protein [uncultured Acetatifactor sp.]
MYEEYITEIRPMAAAVGRRMPYHLEYIRKYGKIAPVPADKGKVASEREEGLMET